MMRKATWLLAAACLLAQDVYAGQAPAQGKFLVASRALRGPAFAETVILLVHYDETGAMGLIVNRPTDLDAVQALPRLPQLAQYDGQMYIGGPVSQRRVMALLRAERPPPDTATIIGDVHFSPLNEAVLTTPARDASALRLYLGYAGWGPGQLDAELERGSWHVVTASVDLVFSDQPQAVWRQLLPPPTYQVRVQPGRAAFMQ